MLKHVIGVLAIAALTACGGGGGGGSDGDGETNGSAQGFWVGDTMALLVTPQNEVYGYEIAASVPTLYTGTAATSGNSFTADITAHSTAGSSVLQVNGTFTAKDRITGQSTLPAGGTASFSAIYEPAYDLSPESLAGTWHPADGGELTVAADGSLAGSNAGCNYTGQVTPDASGKNFYRASFTYADSTNCPLPGQTITGAAVQIEGQVIAIGTSGSQAYYTLLTRP